MKSVCTILLILFNLICFGQTDVKVILDSVFVRTKQISMYSSLINWDSLRKEVFLKAENASTLQDLKPAFTTLLNGLLDKHGRILNAKTYVTIAYFTDYSKLNHPDKRIREPEVWKVVNDTSLQFEYKILTGRIGYLKIVGIAPNIDIEKESIKIRSAVIKLSKAKVDKWIIDLRYNGGGNMHPMVSGIAPIIGDGKVGSLINLNGEKLFDWEILNSNFIYEGFQAVTLPNKPIFKKQQKVAVLTSKWTVSSGEIVATCFKGRPNTKFFGEMTGSYTTSNSWEIINDQIIINISTGIFCDRNGISYEYNIPVDVEIPFELNMDPEKSKCIIEAKNWLLE